MECAKPFRRDLEVVDLGAVPDHEIARGIHLVVGAGRALVAFDQHRAGAVLDHDQIADKTRRRLVAGGDRDDMERPRDIGALGDTYDDAVAHQRRIERNRDITGRRNLAHMGGHEAVVVRQGPRHRADRQAPFQSIKVRAFGNECAIDQDQAAAVDARDDPAAAQAACLGIGVGRACQRLGVAHQHAQVGVFPVLEPPMRKSVGDEVPERGFAQGRGGKIAG